MSVIMFDSVDTPLLPAGNFAYAGYVDGRFANYDAIRARFPKAHVLSIAVFASDDADCLDIETGDATPAEAAAWVARQFLRGVKRPCLYSSASVMAEINAAMRLAGIPRNTLRLWSAHYTFQSHICGPSSCGGMDMDADGTQWTDRSGGINLDESVLLDSFFGGAPAVPSLTPEEMTSIMNQLPVLSLGASDTKLPHFYVRRVQSILNGVYGATLKVDGEYGPASVSAVRTLIQERYGLAKDGIVGPDTWSKLIAG